MALAASPACVGDSSSDDEEGTHAHNDAKAKDDETPAQFAERHSVDLRQLIELNFRYKNLRAHARLEKGTVLLLPDGRPTQREFEIEAILGQRVSDKRYVSPQAIPLH